MSAAAAADSSKILPCEVLIRRAPGFIWAISAAILFLEQDLGTLLIFFGLFVVMLYVATGRSGWIAVGLVMTGVAVVPVALWEPHVHSRFVDWLHPMASIDAGQGAGQLAQPRRQARGGDARRPHDRAAGDPLGVAVLRVVEDEGVHDRPPARLSPACDDRTALPSAPAPTRPAGFPRTRAGSKPVPSEALTKRRSEPSPQSVLTSWISFVIDAFASPKSITVFGL